MHRLLLSAVAVALLLAGCAGDESSVTQGQAAPPLAIITLVGEPVELRPAVERPLWLTFWATWCYPCRAEWPGLNQAQRGLAAQGVTLVAISVNEPADTVKRFLEGRPASFEVALDPQGSAARRYGVIGFPTHVLIDKDGIVCAIVRGPLDEERARALLHLSAQPAAAR